MEFLRSNRGGGGVRGALPWLFTGLAVFAAAAVVFVYNPAQYSFYPFCLFHRTTGLLCAGCGSLRALHALLHGHFLEAARLNLVLILSLPFLACWGIRQVLRKPGSKPDSNVIRPAWLWSGLLLLVLFSVARNLPFARQAWLAP